MTGEKRLRPGERRYVAKEDRAGRKVYWGVYDRQTGSWPGFRPGFGQVGQGFPSHEEALAEADRLEVYYAAQQ